MSRKFFLILLILPVFIVPLFATNELSFSTITVADGLNSSKVFAVSQDCDGFMWFGTDNGVCRFDGKTFRNYRYDVMETNGLSDSYVNCLYRMKDGRLLIGTRRGINVYKPIEDRFEMLHLSAFIDGEEIRTLYEFGESLYVGTSVGLYVFDSESGKLSRSFSTADSGLPHDIVRCVYCDGKYLFIGTFDGFCRYDMATEEWFTVDLKSKRSDLRNNLILSIIPSPFDDTRLLVGTQTGMCEVDRNSLDFKVYDTRNYSMNNITIKTMCRSGNEVWIGTENGLIVWNGSDFKNYTYSPQDSHSLVNNLIWDIYKDSKGGIWLATDNGVCYYDTNIPNFSKVDLIGAENNPFVGIDIFDAIVDSFGNLWLSSKSGLAKYSPQQNSMQWKEALAGKSGVYNFIRSLHIDNYGIIWIGTSEGLRCYDTVREKYEEIQSQLKYKLKYTVSVTSDVDGRVYASATNGNTQIITYQVDTITGKVKIKSEQSISVNDQITSLAASGNTLWYGTANNGVIRKNIATGQLKRYYSKSEEINSGGINVVRSMCAVSGMLYVGTSNGVFFYDERQDFFVPIGGNSENIEILTMEKDSSGFLWYTTPRYIACFNEKEGTCRRFSLNSWFDRRNNVVSASCVKDNDVYLLGTDSYLKANVHDIHNNAESKSLLISELKINDIHIERMGITDVPLTNLKILDLKHDQNNLAFSFAMLDYSDPSSVIYRYRLKGYDDWKSCSNLQNYVVYSMLPFGKYKLQVSAVGGLGVKSSNVLEIDISIAAPPWLSWWAVLGYIAVAFGVVAVVIFLVNRRRQISDDLARAKMEKENAESLSNLKLQFFTNISHDFRTPISLIISPVETLIETEDDERKLNYLNIIKTNSLRLLTLVNQILDFRKAESDKQTLDLASGDIVSSLRDIIYSFSDIASKKNIFIDFDSVEKSLVCDYDKKKIDKIFVNLISNAVKYTKENGQVVVSFRRKDNMEMEVMVADSGIGIAEKDLPHIFDRFYAADNYSSLGGGIGLGLMIVKNLVELHGGSVSVYSKLNVGSTFIVTLPVVHEVQDADMDDGETVSVTVEKKHSYSVLIVEDDENMRNYLVAELGQYYDVFPFSNAEDALASIGNLMPDLVVSDVMLGEDRMKGTDFCRRLRSDELWKTLPVILLTAVISEEQVVEGFDVGASDYIGKPFNIHVLLTRIDNLLGHIQYVRDAISHNMLTVSKSEIKSPDELFMVKLIALIEENIAEPDLDIPFLCDRMAMSHVSFYRKVKSLTGQSINSFVREIRLKKAAQMLEVKGVTVTDAMYAVGFNHRSYFSSCFKEMFGQTPKMYAKQHNDVDKDKE